MTCKGESIAQNDTSELYYVLPSLLIEAADCHSSRPMPSVWSSEVLLCHDKRDFHELFHSEYSLLVVDCSRGTAGGSALSG